MMAADLLANSALVNDELGICHLGPAAAGEAVVSSAAAWAASALPTTAGEGEVQAVAFSAANLLVPQDATDGRTSIEFRNDPFANFAGGFSGVRYVKGSIVLSDPSTVYFQDSVKYVYHYDFATERLAPFQGMSHDSFDAVSLNRNGQQVVMFTVLFSPSAQELAVQIVGRDAYPREDVANWIRTIAAAVHSDQPFDVLYMPSYEQTAAAEADRSWFQSQGITIADSTRWMQGDVSYSDGWASGRLVNIPAAQITAAYGDGRLKPTDILLLTDGVPAEVPYVRGIITLVPAVPNSHVAILARNQQMPFIWVQNAADQQRILSLVGRSVLLRASSSKLDVAPLDDPMLPSSFIDWLNAQQTPAQAQITPKQTYGKWLESATDLTPDLIKYFGGKASNYGLLRRTVPENSQPAMAFSFDLWDAFMSNINPKTGRTLRAEIDLLLGDFSYPPDMTQARAKLAEVNTLIRKTVKWTDAQRQQILSELITAFPDLPENAFLRFRSSSNAEDSQELTGAGLYDSFSGNIADDTDGDSVGPSHGDPNEPDEKGVFRAIEKVFASFYNENAWLERLRHGVDEADTGMAILVHQNFPDSLEMANGVVTFKFQRHRFGDFEEIYYQADIVTQQGAMSVTNPEGGAIAELVKAFASPGGDPYLYVQTGSTVVPVGTTVMDWQNDYPELMRLITKVAEGYSELYPGKDEFTLDLEFKRMVPGTLIIKQVREIPTPQSDMVAPQLANTPTDWKILQSEFSDVWANHRLKSTMSMTTINGALDGANPIKQLVLSLPGGQTPVVLNGAPASLPGASYESALGESRNVFTVGTGASQRTIMLTTSYPSQVDRSLSPVITPEDFTQQLTVKYASPMPWLSTTPSARLEDRVTLVPAEQLKASTEIQTRTWQVGNVQIVSRFKWADVGGGMVIKTLPLGEWVDTVITGLTTQPIRLTSDAAQTYAPGHHNFTEQFLFEPGLDPSLTAAQRAELAAKNVKMIHVFDDRANIGGTGAPSLQLTYIGADDKFRVVSEVDMTDVTVRVGQSVSLTATGVDVNGRRVVFSNPTWEAAGGGTLTQRGARWSFHAEQVGRWEVIATDPNYPGITGKATVLATGVELGYDAILRVVGSSKNDHITLKPVGDGMLEVRTSFADAGSRVQRFPLEQIYRIEVYGGAGRDSIIAEGVAVPLVIDGGDDGDLIRGGTQNDILLGGGGDDKLWGGDGADILLGGAGADYLSGDAGRNLLIGGDGRDQLLGGSDEDILIAGRTVFSDPAFAFDANVIGLQSILNEWNADRTVDERRNNLTGKGSSDRLNEDFFLLLGTTVTDESRSDPQAVRSRRHWILAAR